MNAKSWIKWPLMALLMVATFTACDDDDDEDLVGNWIVKGAFDGWPRSGAAAFVIDQYAYMTTGYNGEEDERLTDTWRYDPSNDTWSQVADFPGVGRNKGVGFAAGGKGVVGSGFDGTNKLKDFFIYDPATNTWGETGAFPGSARYSAVAFGIGEFGYVGTGYDGNILKDFYCFNPSTNAWETIASIGGSKRRDATSFVINNKAYVVTGMDNSMYVKDMWEFDPTTRSWTEKRKISNVSDDSYDDEYNIAGSSKVGFAINGTGYVTTGGSGTAGSTTWEYNPVTDLWAEKSNFEGSARMEAIAFAIGNQAFVATGRSSGYYFDDVYTFDPSAEQEDND